MTARISDSYDKRLESFEQLKPGWDGHGSVPPSAAAIDTARYMTVVPGGDGSLQIEMHAGGIDLEIEITSEGKVGGIYYQQP